MTITDIKKETSGDIYEMYARILADNNGDYAAARAAITRMLAEEEAELARAKAEYEKGEEYVIAAHNLNVTAKAHMEEVKAEWAKNQGEK